MTSASTLTLLMLAWAAIMGLAAYSVRKFRLDAYILGISAVIFEGHILLWQSSWMPKSPAMALPSLLVGPDKIYLLGAGLGLRYFFTPVRGWPRWIYLISGLLALSPLILLFVVVPLAFLLAR